MSPVFVSVLVSPGLPSPPPSPHSARPNYPRVFLLWLTPLMSWRPSEIFRTSCVQFGRKQSMTPVSGGSRGRKTDFFKAAECLFFPPKKFNWKHLNSKEYKRTNTTYTSAALVRHRNLCVLPAVAYFHTAGYLLYAQGQRFPHSIISYRPPYLCRTCNCTDWMGRTAFKCDCTNSIPH